MQVAIMGEREISAPYSQLDQLVALNGHTIVLHQEEVKRGGVVVYDVCNVKCQMSNVKSKSQISKLIDNSQIPALTGTYTVNKAKAETKLRQDIKFIPINLTKIAEEVGGDKIMKNVAAVGAGLALFEQKVSTSRNLLKIADVVLGDVFRKKGDEIVRVNRLVLEEGYKSINF